MQYIVKLFPEIIVKSRPVRKQFIKQLADNLRRLLRAIDPEIAVVREWDRITIETAFNDDHPTEIEELVTVLANTPGIAHFVEVVEHGFSDLHDIYEKTRSEIGDSLDGKRFAVRCKRTGEHDFNSNECERYVGGGLNQHTGAAGVDLGNPDVTVNIEIRKDRLYIVRRRYEGQGGYPIGSVGSAVSLISGGFDSTVSTYMVMRRGIRSHFCFFNLGGRDHEIGVKEVALFLWMKFGASHRVQFITVPFEDVVAEILEKVGNAEMGVVLKRMMLRAASEIAESLNAGALVTGESVAQVSSQTLTNLSVIDSVTDTLVLRPLITADKQDIIATAARIGTEPFAAAMPEYCGVISVRPTTRAKPERVAHQESKFDFAVLDRAVANARRTTIDALVDEELATNTVEVLAVPLAESVVLDIRHPDDVARHPLALPSVTVQCLPFYQLHSRSDELRKSKTYMLYCDKGVMSRLHASHLVEQGFDNVKVYRPA